MAIGAVQAEFTFQYGRLKTWVESSEISAPKTVYIPIWTIKDDNRRMHKKPIPRHSGRIIHLYFVSCEFAE